MPRDYDPIVLDLISVAQALLFGYALNMGLKDTLAAAASALSSEKVSFALIGGFALAAHGVMRATQDIDLLVDGEQKAEAAKALEKNGFISVRTTAEVSHFGGTGQLDILWANREPTRNMLKSAIFKNGFPVPVVSAEDLIGLKIQAYKNDLSREFQDKADIQALLKANDNLDMTRIKAYADLFTEWTAIEALRKRI